MVPLDWLGRRLGSAAGHGQAVDLRRLGDRDPPAGDPVTRNEPEPHGPDRHLIIGDVEAGLAPGRVGAYRELFELRLQLP